MIDFPKYLEHLRHLTKFVEAVPDLTLPVGVLLASARDILWLSLEPEILEIDKNNARRAGA